MYVCGSDVVTMVTDKHICVCVCVCVCVCTHKYTYKQIRELSGQMVRQIVD